MCSKCVLHSYVYFIIFTILKNSEVLQSYVSTNDFPLEK
nr:MAG TPA: hypothetical protein [Caudoviricetes sp.]